MRKLAHVTIQSAGFFPAGSAAKTTRQNISHRQNLAVFFPTLPLDRSLASLTRSKKKKKEKKKKKRKRKTRHDTELTHSVKAANEEYGVRFVPPAWVLLRVQRVHRPKPRPRKSSCAIRNKRNKNLDLFPDGAGDRLTFQSVEIRRLDFQRFSPSHWLRSPIDL